MKVFIVIPLFFFATLLSTTLQAGLRVELEGVEDALRDNVLALLTVQREREQKGLSEAHIRRYFMRGPEEIRRALEPFGYYAVQVDSRLQQQGKDWVAHYRIQLGEPVRFRHLDIRLSGPGEADKRLQQAVAELKLRAGQPARHEDYEQAKSSLEKAALARGYLDARYRQHELRIDVQQQVADVSLELATGPQFHFGSIRFGESELDDSLLRRYLNFKTGDPYSTRQLLDLQRALEDSDYFAKVDVMPLRDQAQAAQVPVQIDLESQKRHKYSVGLGFGTDTGARGLLGWENRRVNRYGHRMGVDLRGSEIGSSLKANYSLPLANPRTDRLEFSAAQVDEDTDTADSTRQTIGVGRTVARGRWRETLSLSYEREAYQVGLIDETTTLLIPAIGYSQVRADNRLVTRHGWRLQLDLRGAAEPLLSDTSFVQTEVKAKWIRALSQRGRVIARAEGGTTWVDANHLLPVSARFFAGGDQSVRGYGYQELGPLDGSGNVVGGKHLIFGSLEYEHRIKGNWGVALFVDTGNAFNSLDVGLETGAGIGLRWESPIGMVRLDVASAVSQDNALRVHFTLGPDL